MNRDGRVEAAQQLYARAISVSSGALRPRLEAALRSVRREDFLGSPPWYVCVLNTTPGSTAPEYLPVDDPIHVYQSWLFAIDRDKYINNGEPSLHAILLGALAPKAGETILHIGAGNGYYTAILAELVGPTGKIIAYEIVPEFARAATQKLAPWRHVEVRAASAAGVALPKADGVYVNAGVTRPPAAWLDALNEGGRFILPLTATAPSGAYGVTFLVRRAGDSYPVSFVTRAGWIGCAGVNDAAEGMNVERALMSGVLFRARQLVRSLAPDQSALLTGDGWWLSSEAVSESKPA